MMSRSELSRRSGVPISTLVRWEADGSIVPVERTTRGVMYANEAVARCRRLHKSRKPHRWDREKAKPTQAKLPAHLTIAETAAALGCSVATVHRYAAAGTLERVVGVHSRDVRITRASVTELLRRRFR